MAASTKTHIIKIGNSQAIRIPRIPLDQASIKNEVELEVQSGALVVRPAGHPREGWEEQFRLMAERGDDMLLDDATEDMTPFDSQEWEW